MLRYLALATAIVLAVAIGVAGWVNRDMIRIKIASVYGAARPKPEPMRTTAGESEKGLRGDAPWALSALPECLIQLSKSTGSRDFVLRHVPSGAAAVAVPATLTYGDCTISLVDDEAYVRRGNDRFRIPPRVRFYRSAHALTMLRETAGGNEVRVYEPAHP
jgi:hypothetical protein